jgi:hypothetical protein
VPNKHNTKKVYSGFPSKQQWKQHCQTAAEKEKKKKKRHGAGINAAERQRERERDRKSLCRKTHTFSKLKLKQPGQP